MSERTSTISLRLIYTGNVQGVGFRVTTREIARQFPVTGFVRNLSDGTVELAVEGARHAVEQFLDAIAHRFRHNVTHVERTEVLSEGFQSFEIRH